MPKLPIPTIRPWQQHTCGRSTTASTVALASTAATSATGTTIVASGATWTTNQYQNFWVTILTGTGAGQTRNITSNTSTTLTVPTWTTNPDNTSTFQIVKPTFPGLQGSLVPGSTGGGVLANVTYREVVPTAGATQVTARLLTTTAAGTLTVTPIRLLAGTDPNDQAIVLGDGTIDTTKVQKYATGGSSATAVVAGTELAVTINPAGEAYCLLEFAVTTAGTLNYCDVMALQSGGSAGSGSNVTINNFPATQPVSIATGQAAEINTNLQTINTSINAAPGGPLLVQPADGTNTLLLNPASTVVAATAVALPVVVLPNNFVSVTGSTNTIVPTLAVTASAYATNECMGGKLTLTNALRVGGPLTGIWAKLQLTWHGATPPALTALLFNGNPSATFTDQGAFPTLSASDMNLVSSIVTIATTDWTTVGGSSFCTKVLGTATVAGAAATLYAAFNVTSGTPTPAATTDFGAKYGFLND